MKKKIAGFLICLLLPAAVVQAQEEVSSPDPLPDNKMIPSVTGNSSISNISSPSLFDGSVNISVPIYNFSNGYGDYGVSFSYNTKGVQVDEIASPVGLHWNIRTGGTIQRVLKDMPDELFKPKEVTDTNIADSIILMGKLAYALSSYTNPAQHIGNYSRSRFDEEYDDFIVSVPGLSFTFNIGKDGFVFTHPKKYVKIELLLDGVVIDSLPVAPLEADTYRNISFVITDDRGIQYYFEKGAVMEYKYISLNDEMSPDMIRDFITTSYIQNWNLSKIVFPDQSRISYYYRPGKTETSPQTTIQSQLITNSDSGPPYILHYSRNNVDVTDIAMISPVIDSIVYPNNVIVNFMFRDYSGAPDGVSRCDFYSAPLLEEIRLYSSGKLLRYILTQKYVNSSTGAVTSIDSPCEAIAGMPPGNQMGWYYRLLLEKIEVGNADLSKKKNYYSFNYHHLVLPHRMHTAQDLYGYYNGNTPYTGFPTLTIPRHRNFYGFPDSFGVWRNYSPYHAQAGLLKRVVNLYGGVLEYEYEGHVLSQPNIPFPSSDAFHGRDVPDGVRVKRIRQYDMATPERTVYTDFTYEGGILFMPGGFFHSPRNVSATGQIIRVYVSNNFTSPHHLINGANHGYSKVTTTTTNDEAELLGKRVVRFTNIIDSSGTPASRYTLVGGNRHYYQYPFADRQYLRDWEIGLPIEIIEYDQNNRIISRTANQYSFSIDSTSTAGKVENKKILKMYRYGMPIFRIDSASYRPYTGQALLNKTITQQYITDASILYDTVTYTYDLRNNLSTMTAVNSKKKKILTRNIYQYQVGNPPVSIGGFPVPAGLKIGTETWKLDPVSASNDLLVSAAINKYSWSSGKLQLDKNWKFNTYNGTTRAVYQLNSSSINEPDHQVKTAYSASDPGPLFEAVTEVVHREPRGNTEELRMLDRDITVAMLWDTVSGHKLAEVGGAHYDEVGYAGFDDQIPNYYEFTAATKRSTGHFTGHLVAYQSGTVSIPGICGKFYKLNPTLGHTVKFDYNMKIGKEYILSFWSRGGQPAITGGGVATFTLQEVYTQGSWKYYVAKFKPTATTPVTLSGKSGYTLYVDEVRLHPSDVQMSTTNYTPLFGKIAESDARGRIIYYEYDDFGSLRTVKDQEGNVLKHIQINLSAAE